MNNLPIDIKHIFLSFLQFYFKEFGPLRWDEDVTKTHILILDSNAYDIGIEYKRPVIILKRGTLGWTNLSIGQNGINTVGEQETLLGNSQGISHIHRIVNDLIQGNIALNIISKNSLQAELIATTVFNALTMFKHHIRANSNIHSITNLVISPEQNIKQDSEVRLTAVTVSFNFLYNYKLKMDSKLYNIIIYNGNEELYENFDYTIVDNGTKIISNKDLTNYQATYIDAITLETKNTTFIDTNQDNKYKLKDNGKILGYYSVLKEVDIYGL